MAAELVMRSQRERVAVERERQKVDTDIERVRAVAEFIKHMNEIYRERLEGRRVRQP